MSKNKQLYASIDKPWQKFYSKKNIKKAIPSCSIYDFLYKNNRKHLDDSAIEYDGKLITFGELFTQIDIAELAFKNLGVQEGDVIVIVSLTIPELIISFYALNKIGAVPNFVDPRTSVEGIQAFIKEVDSKLIICLDVCYKKLVRAIENTLVEHIVVISLADSAQSFNKKIYAVNKCSALLNKKFITWNKFLKFASHSNKFFFAKSTKNNKTKSIEKSCAVIVHTGGTTGMPKSVMLSNKNLNASVIQCCCSGFNFCRHDTWLGIMPPFISYGIANGVHLPLCKGMKLILIPNFNPKTYDKLLLKHKPNHVTGVPTYYNSIIKSKLVKNADLSFLVSP
ncbi:MAG: long-chain fatty acid--CoA ligase, partial [Coriobacteriales bacterium]|nr:long-chain fatty acid--CoA ligase [Coriobacteriales bacterium]